MQTTEKLSKTVDNEPVVKTQGHSNPQTQARFENSTAYGDSRSFLGSEGAEYRWFSLLCEAILTVSKPINNNLIRRTLLNRVVTSSTLVLTTSFPQADIRIAHIEILTSGLVV